jgi:cytochrome c5
LFAVCYALTICFAACANEADVAPDAGGEVVVPIPDLSTGSTCPENSALSYENFGRAFFESYCLRCHSAAISGSGRLAPVGRDFDDLAMIRANALYIDQFAAAGPKGEQMSMPPGAEKPTLGQRTQLGEWLACGAPRL